jgi:glycerol transport system ATP-binding protein
MIYVTHDQTEALTFADEVVVMQHGQVLQRGTPEQLFRRPAHTYVGYFIGSPGMNVLPCEARGARARVGEHDIVLAADDGPTGSLELGIRPEHIAVAGGEAGLPLVITAIEDHGRFRIVSARLDELPVKLRLGPAAADEVDPPVVGQTLRVAFPPERICLYRDGRIVAPAAAREGAA